MGHLRKYVLKSYCHYVAGVSLNYVVIMARGMNGRHALPIMSREITLLWLRDTKMGVVSGPDGTTRSGCMC